MSRRSVVPWWGRLLPYLCFVLGSLCLSWALDIEGWRLAAVVGGVSIIHLGHVVAAVNGEASR